MNILRQYVGGPKNRYKDDEFNLDLTYITSRVIAMAFPASGLEKLYRNSIDKVKQFLVKNHGESYLIINLSSREIDETKLTNTLLFEWEDHQAPPLDLLFQVCQKIVTYLDANQRNVVAIHCNHGKGRTGTLICCLLLYSSSWKSTVEANTFYTKKRFEVEQGNGVTQPCQLHYIEYFGTLLKNSDMFPETIAITGVTFRGHCKYTGLYIKVKNFTGKEILTTKKCQSIKSAKKIENQSQVKQYTLLIDEKVYFSGDIRVMVKGNGPLGNNCVASYSFNTAFVHHGKIVVKLCDLSPYSLRKGDTFSQDFQIQIQYVNQCQECPKQIDLSKRCGKCRQSLGGEELKWKKIKKILSERSKKTKEQLNALIGKAEFSFLEMQLSDMAAKNKASK